MFRRPWSSAVVEFVERVGFYGMHGNLIMYLTGSLGLSTAAAAAGVNAWSGTASMLPLVGALAADFWIGRYRAVVAAGVLYLVVCKPALDYLPFVSSFFRGIHLPADSLSLAQWLAAVRDYNIHKYDWL